MKLITAAILKAAPALYATEKVPTEDKLLVAKFFHPSGRGTWYMAEYDPEQRLAFGFCVSPLGPDCDEWGYFSMDELEEVMVHGLGIERDTSFRPTKFSDI
jgi:hypothetical protein